jgi:hypothetical protein
VLLTVRNFAEPVFAPIISNRSAEPIGIVVNPGLRSAAGRLEEVDCTCRIEPGTENEFIGYYRAYANSGVRITTPDGRSVTFADVAGESSPRSGASPLRINPR